MIRALACASLFGLLLSSPLPAQVRGPVELAGAAVPGEAARLAYGSDPVQFGELRVPATAGPHPVAIVVHGGCWLAQLGNLDPRAVALDNMRPLSAALVEAGIATWNIEYRRVGNGGGWPTTFHDVANAADHLQRIARDYQLDLGRIIAVGHSSGGHLAMWLATRPRLPSDSELYAADPLRLIGVASLDGPADLQTMHPLEERVCGSPVVTELMGGRPDELPARYRETSPIELLPLGVRQAVFAGRMFAEHARSYETAAVEAGDRVESVIDGTAGHFVFIDPESAMWPQVLRRIQWLLAPE
jgi:acetyl esterase/lipase